MKGARRRRVSAVAGLALGAAQRMGGCPVQDANGCCVSSGFFYCGSSARCAHESDACEDLRGAAPDCAVSNFKLDDLRISKGNTNYEVLFEDTTVVFNLCGNAATPNGCAFNETPAAAYAIKGAGCLRLSSSVATAGPVLSLADTAILVDFPAISDPLRVLVRCDASAADPVLTPGSSKNGYEVHMASVHGCPAACVADNALCSDRGECKEAGGRVSCCFLQRVLGRDATCSCAEGYAGRRCESRLDTAPPKQSYPLSRIALTLTVICLVSMIILKRCARLRRLRREDVRAQQHTRYRTVPVDNDDDDDDPGFELQFSDMIS